jgi:hypothetical protein
MLSCIAKLSEGYKPYSFSSTAENNCSGLHHFQITSTQYGMSEFLDTISLGHYTNLTTLPVSLEYPYVQPSTSQTKSAKIIANVSDIFIDSIYIDNSAFQVINTSTNFPVLLKKDNAITIDVQFSPTDQSLRFGRLLIKSNSCSYDTLFLTGGFPNVEPHIPTIKIINPVCNDVLVIGDTIELK